MIYSGLALKEKSWSSELNETLKKAAIALIVLVGIYEAISGLGAIGEAPFSTMFYGYIAIGLVLPLLLLLVNQNFLAGILIAIGTFASRELLAYGGNAEPMTNRSFFNLWNCRT